MMNSKHKKLCITKTRLLKYTENFTIKKNEKIQIKNSDILLISAQTIDCGYSLEPPRRGGSNEYPQSMFLSRYRKNNIYPCKPQFYYIKVGFKGSKLYRHVFVMNFKHKKSIGCRAFAKCKKYIRQINDSLKSEYLANDNNR